MAIDKLFLINGERCPKFIERTSKEICDSVKYAAKQLLVNHKHIELSVGEPPEWVRRDDKEILLGCCDDLELPWVVIFIADNEKHQKLNTDPIHTSRHEVVHMLLVEKEEFVCESVARLIGKIYDLEQENKRLREELCQKKQ